MRYTWKTASLLLTQRCAAARHSCRWTAVPSVQAWCSSCFSNNRMLSGVSECARLCACVAVRPVDLELP